MNAVPLDAVMMDDMELFIFRWRLKICSDGFELGVRGPWATRRQVLTPSPKLNFAQGVGRVYKVQFMLNAGVLNLNSGDSEMITQPANNLGLPYAVRELCAGPSSL